MAQLRFKGLQTGSAVDMEASVDGGTPEALSGFDFRAPAVETSVPRINTGGDQFVTATWSLDETGLTNISARQWTSGGVDISGQTGATLDTTGRDGEWIACKVTADPSSTVYTTPASMVYASGDHTADDQAIADLLDHQDATHIATTTGDWSNTATWEGGAVPSNGARVLIAYGVTVTYDVDATEWIRLDTVRVDGTLNWALDQSTQMVVENLVGTRGSTITIGTSGSNRLPLAYTAEIIFSGKDYRSNSYTDTDMVLARNPKAWGRGFVSLGTVKIWGYKKTSWVRIEPLESGATSMTCAEAPVGWQAGDQLLLPTTTVDYDSAQPWDRPLVIEDEYVTIDSIVSTTVNFTGVTTNAHKNQLTGSTRTDLKPIACLRKGRNIKFQSEVTTPHYRRGHTAFMHHHLTAEIYDAQFIDLGRTSKEIPAGRERDPGEFIYNDGAGIASSTLDAQSNIISRYPVHVHFAGFKAVGARPTIRNCYVEATPGWAMVHHGCAADMDNNVMHLFEGGGMIAESGNETGSWVQNVAATTTETNVGLHRNAKNLEGIRGSSGDSFHYGSGYGLRGRAMRVNGNIATGCQTGYVFFHRGNTTPSETITDKIDIDRTTVDLKDVSALATGDWVNFDLEDYPIIHFADNESIGCYYGMFITKDLPIQQHDANVNIKRFKGWGCISGQFVEYVGAYALSDPDVVAAQSERGAGVIIGGNTYQVGLRGATMEGFNQGLIFDGGTDTQEAHDLFDTTDFRWFQIATDFKDNLDNVVRNVPSGGLAGTAVTLIDEDFDDTGHPRDDEPTWTFPQKIADYDGTTATNHIVETDGAKSDSGGAQAFVKDMTGVPADNAVRTARGKIWNDQTFGSDFRIGTALGEIGYYQLNGGSINILPVQFIISSRISARPKLVTGYYQETTPGDWSAEPNNATAYNLSTNAVVQSDKTAAVASYAVGATPTSVSVDVVTGATGGNGSTYRLAAEQPFIAPDYGEAELDDTTGEVTFTPQPGYEGSDEMYVFVESDGQFATVKVSFLINAGATEAAPAVPAVTTNFTVGPGGAGEIDVVLTTPPDTDGRRIRVTQYTTDAGVTWRRLCNGWKGDTYTLTVESDGTALAAGDYDISFRYKTDYDEVTTAGSAAETVTVT